MRTLNDGHTATIEPGDKGADYVSLSSVGGTVGLKAAGVVFVIRYIARKSAIGKVITPTEVAALHEAGIALLLNYEGSTTDYTQGAPGGAANGAWSRNFARGIGYPDELPLFVSVDTDVFAANLGSARAYVRAFMDAANPHRPGVYGDVDIMREVRDLNPVNWRANAVGWGRDTSALTIHVQQGRQANGMDPNVCQAPFDAWLPHTIVAAPPVVVPPPEVSPAPLPPVTGPEELMHVLLEVHDSAGRKLAAMFYATLDSRGTAHQCEWTGDGNPATPTGRKLADHLAHGMTVAPIGLGSFADMTRLGPCPPAETLHNWTDADFARVIGA